MLICAGKVHLPSVVALSRREAALIFVREQNTAPLWKEPSTFSKEIKLEEEKGVLPHLKSVLETKDESFPA